MYGAPYAQPPVARAPEGRPSMVLVAVAALFVTILCCLVETALEILIYQSFGHAMKSLDSTGQGVSELRPWLVMTVGGNAIIAMALGVGVALLFRRNNVGRIVIWSAGGVCVLVRLCCLSGVGLFGVFNQAMQSASAQYPDSGMTSFAPSWQVWSAVATSSIALVAVVISMIVIALTPVNRYFRKRPAVPAAPAYPGPGQPYGGWGY